MVLDYGKKNIFKYYIILKSLTKNVTQNERFILM